MNEKQIFTKARLYDDSVIRDEFITKQCAGDLQLKKRIDRLLRLDRSHNTLLERQAVSVIEDLQSGSTADSEKTSDDHTQQVLDILEPTDDASLGRLEHYVISDVIGRGGFGVVLKAFDDKLSRTVAIKVLSPLMAAVEIHRLRFLREARSAGSVHHDNVVRVHAVEEHPVPFIVMECVAGETLQRRLLTSGPMTPEQTVRVGLQVAHGLKAAHEKGIVHRDVKPSNIMVESGDDLRIRLTDFGLAFSNHDPALTQTGLLMGTPAYMSPEQALGETIDQRSDLFSLGSVLYAMCTGRPPFEAPNTLALLRNVAEGKTGAMTEVGRQIPVRLRSIIERLHRRNPDQRYQTGDDVIRDLERSLSPESGSERLFKVLRPAIIVTMLTATIVGAVLLQFDDSLGGKGVAENALPAFSSDVGSGAESETLAADSLMSGVDGNAFPEQEIPDANPEVESQRQSAQELIYYVIAEMQKLNPGFNPNRCQYRIEGDRVVGLETEWATNYEPLRRLTDVESLRLYTSLGVAELVDLSFVSSMKKLKHLDVNGLGLQSLEPLRGLPLETLGAWCWNFNGLATDGDLSALEGMPLRNLNIGLSVIKDLEPLRGMPLHTLTLNSASVSDLSPLRNMDSLRILSIPQTQVNDLSPLKGLTLEELHLDGTAVDDLSPVLGQPIKRIHLLNTQLDDYSVVKEFPLTHLWMDFQPVRDIALIESLPHLEQLNDAPVSEVRNPALLLKILAPHARSMMDAVGEALR